MRQDGVGARVCLIEHTILGINLKQFQNALWQSQGNSRDKLLTYMWQILTKEIFLTFSEPKAGELNVRLAIM